jgi:LacI family transcriptional regulator
MPRRSVALLIESSNAYARGLLQGIIAYQQQHDAWSVYLPELDRGASPPKWIRNWRGEGVIARIETEEIAKIVQRIGIPVVDVSAARHLRGIPWVETDDPRVSELAVEHLIERGFRNLAFYGDPKFNWSIWRRDHFIASLQRRGLSCEIFDAVGPESRGYSWPRENRRLANWIRSLIKPVGLMASYDIGARQVLDACRELNIMVPEEIAVIGVDDDPIVCNLAFPSLTSVIPDAAGAGYRAAELLDLMMSGGHPESESHFLAPLGISTRQSTDIFAVEDPEIRRAAKLIREQACTGITVLDVLGEVSLSRRVFESRFRNATGQTPHEAILAQRLKRVEQLLRESDLPLEAIAAKTGFEHPEYMSVAFRKHFKVPPGKYRSELRSRQ